MAILSGWERPINTSNLPYFPLFSGSIFLYSSFYAQVIGSTPYGGKIYGDGLTFAAPATVTGGAVTGFSVDRHDDFVFVFGKLALSAPAFGALATLSSYQITARLLAGSDEITGSTERDRLDGFTGNDRMWGND